MDSADVERPFERSLGYIDIGYFIVWHSDVLFPEYAILLAYRVLVDPVGERPVIRPNPQSYACHEDDERGPDASQDVLSRAIGYEQDRRRQDSA